MTPTLPVVDVAVVAAPVVLMATAPLGPPAMTVTATLALGKFGCKHDLYEHLTDIIKASTRSRPVTAGATPRAPPSTPTRRPVPTLPPLNLRTTPASLPTPPLPTLPSAPALTA